MRREFPLSDLASGASAETNPVDGGESPAEPLLHVLAGLLAQSFAFSLRVLPGFIVYPFANMIAVFLFVSSIRHDRRVEKKGRGMSRNQKIAFRSQWTPRLGRKLRWGWARHVAHTVVDFARFPRLTADNIRRFVNLDEAEGLRAAISDGGGAICATGHIGMWELTCFGPGAIGLPVNGVARPLPIRSLDRLIQGLRECRGARVLPKWGVLFPLRKALQRGELVGLVVDEEVRENPVFAPFLGTAAATNPVPAILHLRTRRPLLVIGCHRQKGWRPRYRFHLWDTIPYASTGDVRRDVQRVTEAMNDGLSRAIEAYPEQWLWGARRFGTRPEGEELAGDGLPPRSGRSPEFRMDDLT